MMGHAVGKIAILRLDGEVVCFWRIVIKSCAIFYSPRFLMHLLVLEFGGVGYVMSA
ncbi:MAG: hypothetical protein ACRCUZ_02240 [Shewanella sp.]